MRRRRKPTKAVAQAQQVGMYLAHTSLQLSLLTIGRIYRRDPRTVAYACHRIEDRRDIRGFDWLLGLIEEICRVERMRQGGR